VACARHAEVHAVLNDHATFISGAGVGLANFNLETPFRPKSLILEADPPLHTQTRTVLSRILSPKAVTQIRATFTAEAEALVERCLRSRWPPGQIDGVHDLAQPYPLKVFPDAVGVEGDGRENLLVYGDLIFNSMGPRNELLARAAAAHGPGHRVDHGALPARHLRPGGFGDQIYQAADAGEISHEQAPLLVRSFLSAGVDTTINGLGNALFSLAHHPEQYAGCTPTRHSRGRLSRRRCATSRPRRPSSAPPAATARSPAMPGGRKHQGAVHAGLGRQPRSAQVARPRALRHRPPAQRPRGAGLGHPRLRRPGGGAARRRSGADGAGPARASASRSPARTRGA
jgi:hypothetical protein